MQVTIKPYYRSVIIDGEEVREKVTPFPDFLNHLASVSCEADDTTHAITRVEGVHRYVSHFIAREYYYQHLDAFITWFYTEKQAQIDKATSDKNDLEDTIEEVVDPRFDTVEGQVQRQEVTSLFYNPNLKSMNLVKGNAATLSTVITEATMSQSGLMTSGDVSSLRNLESQVNSLLSQGIWRATYATYAEMLTANPGMIVTDAIWNIGDFVYVQADEQYDPTETPLTSYLVTTTGSGTSLQLVFRKVEPTSAGVATATNTSLGVVLGTETTPGKVYVETDGSMSVLGWDDLEQNHAPVVMTLDDIETHNDGTGKYPSLYGNRVLVVDEDIEPIAPDTPLLGIATVPFKTVMVGFLSMTRDNGTLTASILPDAYQELVNLKAKNEPNIITFAQYDAKIAADGVCGSFALDEVTQTFKIPYIPNHYIRALDSTTNVGDEQIDQMRPITGTNLLGANIGALSDLTGPYYADASNSETSLRPAGWDATASTKRIYTDTARLGPNYSGDDTHPMSIVWDYQMKVFGRITDVATLNVDQLITTINNKLDKPVVELRVEADGTIDNQVNVTACTVVSTGLKTVTFTNPLTSYRIVLCTAHDGHATYLNPTSGGIQIRTVDDTGNLQDSTFNLVIYGTM